MEKGRVKGELKWKMERLGANSGLLLEVEYQEGELCV